jgi:hypothetical protein
MKNLYFLLLITCLTNGACGNTEHEEFPIKIPFTEYSLGETICWWKDCDSTNNVIIISSDEELNKYVNCASSSYPAVDFSKQSLLLARGKTINGFRCLDVDFSKETACEYALDVTVHTDRTIVAPPLIVGIVVPKLDSEVLVTLNIQQNTSDDDLKAAELSQENLRQTWVLVAKKQGDVVEKWQRNCFGNKYPITLVLDSIRCLGICNDFNHYQGDYDVRGDSISFSDVLLGGPFVTPTWYRDYFRDLTFNVHNVSVFSHSQDTNNMQLQLTSSSTTLYFINKKWFKKTYFEFNEVHPYESSLYKF